jgi:putative DNA primase/helicase
MDPRGLPAEIRTSTRAVVWKYQQRGDRRTKVPYVPRRPFVRAAVDDPSTWDTFDTALAALRAGHADGVGIVLAKDYLAGTDFDDCVDVATGALDVCTVPIVRALDSYTEVTPSGRGVHVLVHGTLPPGGRRRGHVEMYDEGRFFTVTGRHVAGTPLQIHERTAALAALHASVFGGSAAPPPAAQHRVLVEQNDATLLARARAARNGGKFGALYAGDTSRYQSHSEADLALCNLLAFWTGSDAARMDTLFRSSGLMRAKWDEPRGTQTYGELTIAKALGCVTNRRTS